MGQQQIILIILGVIIVGIAIAVGLLLFAGENIQSNKDAMINDINTIAENAFQFRIRPRSMGGGSGSYSGWAIPIRMKTNENGLYSESGGNATGIVIYGKSADIASNTVNASIGSDGRVSSMTFGGDFE